MPDHPGGMENLVESEYQAMVTAARAELLTLADKLKSQLDTLYGIDSDPDLIREQVHLALKHLAGHAQDPEADVPADRGGLDSAA